ncbi:CBS domain-containing protein [Raineyella sp.]|uniref:Inosine-5'-monophosphate dehydrogenase n=1 Tax=bioreactor metagenome TaxID=1076179 RepID=A0A644Z736_9ZZZZ|nr:CBS domain-containing protein [Raineyella sp.]MEA5154813.1 CBS domain-containing protein [Raineyella sp.]
MKIRDLLRRKGNTVLTLAVTATVADAVNVLRDHGIGCVVVTDPTGAIAGLVSERDISHAFGVVAPETPISDLMTRDVRTCPPDEDVEALAAMMTDQRVRHVPVVENGRLSGLVSIGDVVKAHLDELRSERDHLVAYVQSS